MKKTLIISLSFLLTAFAAFAQNDPLYNLYLFNQAMINPAYTGTYNVTNATLLSRAQWTGINGAPVTHTLNASSSLLQEKLGAGLIAINDRLGVNNNLELQVQAAYKIKFGYSQLSFGMQGGFVSYKYNYNDLNLEVVDPTLTQTQQPNFTKPTIGAGVYFRAEKYYAGISIPRLMNVNVEDGVASSTRYKRHLYLSGGFLIAEYESIKIKPSAVVKIVPNQPLSVDVNANILFAEILWAGISVRDFNALGFNAQIELNNKFRFGYVYELPTNNLSGSAGGTHEIMLSMDLEILNGQFALRRYF